LSNVVKNCIESTPDGGQVKISAEENAMYVKLCVIDSGTGIAEEDIPHLFERFYRGKNSGKNGAGIGLALAKAIITQQNGRIIAENIMPCGAKFTIFFDRGVA
jgi:signal transduction histidine kinase